MWPRGYAIFHGSMMLDVAVVDIDEVKPHEETNPGLLSQLGAEIERDRVLKNPVVVDRESSVILDGMHRRAALKTLGCLRIPVCLVDYGSPLVKLGCWYRSFVDSVWRDEVRSVLAALNLKFVELGEKEEAAAVVAGKGRVVIQGVDGSMVVTDGVAGDLDAFSAVRRIEQGLAQIGLRLTYDTELDARQKLLAGQVGAVMSYAPTTKEMIVRTAVSGRMFPPKTTRHVIPARPLGVNVPLASLQDRTRTTRVINTNLVHSLRSRTLRRIPPGSVIEGRKYEEDLYVFED